MSSGAEAGWRVEGEAILNGLTRHQYELVTCVELPSQIEDYVDAAESDPRLDEDYEESYGCMDNCRRCDPRRGGAGILSAEQAHDSASRLR